MALCAGGMLEMIRYNGGLDFITSGLTKRIHSKRGAEFSIAGLVSLMAAGLAHGITIKH